MKMFLGLECRGQMKIMQMMFMILGVFFFFVLVGIFFLAITVKDIKTSAEDLAKEQAISSLEIVADMPEFNYDARRSLTVDEDKLRVLSGNLGDSYGEFWPVASIEVYKVYPAFEEIVGCPASECNYYNVYDSGQKDIEKFSSYISVCERVKEFGSTYDSCSIGKLVVGMKIRGSEIDN